MNQVRKSAESILYEYGINIGELNEEFNNQLLTAMERYAEQFAPAPAKGVEEAAYPNEYVCGFLFDKQVQRVVLIWKEKPAWQKGKLNGVGGKIEPGETPYQAMVREFKEETGLQVENWQPLASVSEDHYRVRFFYAVDDKNQFEYAETKESEEVAKLDLDEHLFSNYPHISNLEWLIDLAINLATAPNEKIIAGQIDFTGSRWQQGRQSMSVRSAINAGSIENSGEGYIGDRIKKEMKGFYSFNHPARKTFDDVCWRLYGMTPDTLFENFRNNTSAFWLDIILPAMQEYADKAAPAIGARWVKGEYDRLYHLGKSGKRIPCFVDHDWLRDGTRILRDIAILTPENMSIGARGICYISPFADENTTEKDEFIHQCEQSNVEWLDESPCTLDAGWMPGTPPLDKPCVFVSKSGSDYSVWEVINLNTGDGSYLAICDGGGNEWGDISDFRCDSYYMLSPTSFPTREQAQELDELRAWKKVVESNYPQLQAIQEELGVKKGTDILPAIKALKNDRPVFPTREDADNYIDDNLHVFEESELLTWNGNFRFAALAMYDWMISQLKRK